MKNRGVNSLFFFGKRNIFRHFFLKTIYFLVSDSVVSSSFYGVLDSRILKSPSCSKVNISY